MSIAGDLLTKKLSKGSEDGKPNGMLLGLLKSMGVNPEEIQGYVLETASTVKSTLAEINSRLERIEALQLTIENKCNEIEHNQGAILRAVEPDAVIEGQYADMASRPLDVPIGAEMMDATQAGHLDKLPDAAGISIHGVS